MSCHFQFEHDAMQKTTETKMCTAFCSIYWVQCVHRAGQKRRRRRRRRHRERWVTSTQPRQALIAFSCKSYIKYVTVPQPFLICVSPGDLFQIYSISLFDSQDKANHGEKMSIWENGIEIEAKCGFRAN